MDLVEQLELLSITGTGVHRLIRDRLVNESVSDQAFEQTLRGPIYETNYTATRFILCALAERGVTHESNIDLWRYNNAKQYVQGQGHTGESCAYDR